MPSFTSETLSAFFSAAERGDARRLEALLAEHPSLGRAVRVQQDDAYTALMLCVQLSKPDDGRCVRALLPFSDPDASLRDGRTALMMAVRAHRPHDVRELLPVCNVNARDDQGNTALLLAAGGCEEACVNALLPHSDPNARNNYGHSALYFIAAISQREHPASTPLRSRMMQRFLAAGVDPLLQDASDKSALHFSARSGCSELVRLLLPVSDPRQVDQEGRTALMMAATHGDAECVRLLSTGVDLHHRDHKGNNALMLAMLHSRPDTVQALLLGSDLTSINHHGQDAIDLLLNSERLAGRFGGPIYRLQKTARTCLDAFASQHPSVVRIQAVLGEHPSRSLFPLWASRLDMEAARLERLALERALGGSTPPGANNPVSRRQPRL